mmetsp:Transcript_41454/g.109046  ORF Transcript_41454/g.109046 Transcript_41454/m.109046 type:complete len:226 (-) Transcript_41454:191-868(-)
MSTHAHSRWSGRIIAVDSCASPLSRRPATLAMALAATRCTSPDKRTTNILRCSGFQTISACCNPSSSISHTCTGEENVVRNRCCRSFTRPTISIRSAVDPSKDQPLDKPLSQIRVTSLGASRAGPTDAPSSGDGTGGRGCSQSVCPVSASGASCSPRLAALSVLRPSRSPLQLSSSKLPRSPRCRGVPTSETRQLRSPATGLGRGDGSTSSTTADRDVGRLGRRE